MKNVNQFFPTEIISDILTCLPAESVLESKLVCKTWNNLIHYPSFPQMHLTRLNHPDSTTDKLRYVFAKPDDDDDVDDDDYDYNNKCLYYLEFNVNEDWNYVKPICRKINFSTGCEGYMLIGSFNGLICVYGTRSANSTCIDGPASIVNPVTKEFIVLPEFVSYPEYDTKGFDSIRYDHLACGFGYLAETNEYKVVRIYKHCREPTVVEVEVYTVGSGKGWRHVGRFDFGFIFHTHCQHTHGVFLNGALYWRNTKGGMVVVFDLADEKFREHISPPLIRTGTICDNDIDGFIRIGVSGGGILYYAVCQCVGEHVFDDLWLLMNKNGNHAIKKQVEHQTWGWNKVASLDQREPFAFTEDGTVLRFDQGVFNEFRSRTSTWEKYTNFCEISCQVFPHKYTLVSLKQLGEEDVKMIKLQEIEETNSSKSGSD